jgi:hypothetical protein
LEDFRKLSQLLVKNLHLSIVGEFFTIAYERFGAQRVKNFMEIQLMHAQ